MPVLWSLAVQLRAVERGLSRPAPPAGRDAPAPAGAVLATCRP